MKLKQVTRTQIAGIAMVCVLIVGGVAMGTTVLAQDSGVSESEPNDGFTDADSVQLGTTFSGTITEDDRDLILVEGIEPGQNVTIEATAGDGELNIQPEIDFLEPGATRQASTIVEDPPRLITVGESFNQDGVTSSDYTIRVTAAGPGGTPTEEPPEETETPTEEPPEETETPTEEPPEETETPTEEPPEETEDAGDGKAKTGDGDNGKAKMGDDSTDDGDDAGNGKAKTGDNGNESADAADGGNGKAKIGDNGETTTETETETNEETTTEAETDTESDLATDASGDLNCEDFPSKDLAQQNLDNNPDDPNGLDADNDGEACDAGVDA